jgi:hypothetical protein
MSDASLAIRSPAHIEPWRDAEWQRLWLSLQTRPWRSLAILPAGGGASEDLALRIAVMLSRTGMLHLGLPVQVADGTRVSLVHLSAFLEQVRRCTSDGEPILVALSALSVSPVALSLAQSTDAALLAVVFEQMAFSDARNTVAQLGASRFIGSAIFHPSAGVASASK